MIIVILCFYLIWFQLLNCSCLNPEVLWGFFSEFPSYPTTGEQADVWHSVTCLSSMKERSSMRTFHVTQAGGPPWRKGCLAPEWDSCARDDFLWAKECAVIYRARQSPMHITHVVDACLCSTPSSCASSLPLMTWRDEGAPTVDEVVCKLWEYKENLSSYPWTCLSVVKKNFQKILSKSMKNCSRSSSNKKKTGSIPHPYRQVSQLLREHYFAKERG